VNVVMTTSALRSARLLSTFFLAIGSRADGRSCFPGALPFRVRGPDEEGPRGPPGSSTAR
jgi:hypothetical protein